MAIDVLSVWKSTLAALPSVGDASWAPNFAGWYADRIVNIETDDSALDVSAGFTFTFNESLFATELTALQPTPSQAAGLAGFADAWEIATLTTTYPATLNVQPGAFIPPSSPTTLFSAVTGVTVDPASIAAGKAKILELASSPPAGDPDDSEFPEKFRDATLLLTITVVGLDSTPSGSGGPLPLTAANVPLL